ncbi:MAG: LamG-like jellyroll fold domain-containing protein [Planctomycetota bacterium]
MVWDFTTADHLDVDDMDSYADNAAIKAVWKDRWWAGAAKNTKAEVFVETDPQWVRNGQSMRYYYVNFGMSGGKPAGSVAEASTADLEIGSDWVTNAPKALVLHFYGDTDNLLEPHASYNIANDRMWVAVEDNVGNDGIVRLADMNDITVEQWQGFNIDLADPCLSTVDMNNIAKVYIGFGGVKGGGVSKYGAGYTLLGDTVWFDDISLYPPRCITEYGPVGDIVGDDCITDHQDIEIVARDWLDTDALISPSEPPTPPLAFYQFETGAGDTIVNDGSLGALADGTIYADGNRPTWVTTDPCAPHAKCMEFDGINDYVGIPDFNSIVEGGFYTNTGTITAWIKRNGPQSFWTGLVFCTRDVPYDWGQAISIFGLSLGDGTGEDWFGCDSNTLNHVAYHWDTRPDGSEVGWMFCPTPELYVPDGEWIFCAAVVTSDYGTVYMSDGTTLYSAVNHDIHLKTTFTEPWSIGRDPRGQWERDDAWWEPPGRAFNGRIDDVRIYDYPLSKGQISWLAGVTDPVYDPLPSPANLLPKDPCDSADPNLGSGAFDPNNIDVIDFRDFSIMANDWLVGPILWP